jgi:hypothetical protein
LNPNGETGPLPGADVVVVVPGADVVVVVVPGAAVVVVVVVPGAAVVVVVVVVVVPAANDNVTVHQEVDHGVVVTPF